MAVKIRLCGNLKEIELHIEVLKHLFPELLFTKPQLGTNPKYKGKDYLSYSKYRQKGGKDMKSSIKKVHKHFS
jgi:hypothetical protein